MTKKDKNTFFYRIGLGFILLSIVSPILGLMVPFLGLSAGASTTLVGILLVGGPEVFLVFGVALAGKKPLILIKQKVLALLNIKAIPKPVGRLRYNIGIVMLVGSILINWALQYVGFFVAIPEHTYNLVITTFVFDVVTVASFFVLGPQFWGKLGKLFVWEEGLD